MEEKIKDFNKISDYTKTVFSHNQDLIQLADSKASIIISVISVLIPIIFGMDVFISTNEKFLNLMVFLYISFLISVALLTITFIFAILVIVARTKEEYGDSIFFANIIKEELKKYEDFIKNLNEKLILEDYIKENYAIAKINEKKYKMFRNALIFLLISVLFLIFRYILLFSCLTFTT